MSPHTFSKIVPPSANGQSILSLPAAPKSKEISPWSGSTDSINDQFWRCTTDHLCSRSCSADKAEDLADTYMLIGALNLPDGARIT